MSRRNRHNRAQRAGDRPDETRARAAGRPGTASPSIPALPPGARPRAIDRPFEQTPGMSPGGNSYGDNSQPIDAYGPQASAAPAVRPGPPMAYPSPFPAPFPGGPGSSSNPVFPPGDPIRPLPGLGPRAWEFPVGTNIANVPRGTEATSFQTLRNLSAIYSGVQLCEAAHYRIVERLTLDFAPRAELLAAGEDLTADKWRTPALRMREWWEEGPAKDGRDLTAWMIAAQRDLLQIDAVGVWQIPTRDGRLHSLRLIAGDTLQCLVDGAGFTPAPPAPAYRQVVYGAPAPLFMQPPARAARGIRGDELDYLLFSPRTDSMYGVSPVERIILDVNTALRKQHFDLAWFTDGSTPEGVIQTKQPELFKMTVDEVREWERMWNAALAGNDAMRVRTRFVPPGFEFTAIKQRELSTALDEWLFNKTLSAFGLTKDELGFTDTSNRSTGQSQEAVTYRQAVQPRANFLARYIRRIVRRYDGQPLSAVGAHVSRPGAPTASQGSWDARFIPQWTGIEEPEDLALKMTIAGQAVDRGILGRTEAKRYVGFPVAKGEQEIPPMITVQGGMDSVVIVADLIANHDKIQQAQQAQLDTKIAGAKAAKQQFEQGGAPVQTAGMGPAAGGGGGSGGQQAGMAAGNVNAGAKQQMAAGTHPAAQTQAQKAPAQKTQGGGANAGGGTAQPRGGARGPQVRPGAGARRDVDGDGHGLRAAADADDREDGGGDGGRGVSSSVDDDGRSAGMGAGVGRADGRDDTLPGAVSMERGGGSSRGDGDRGAAGGLSVRHHDGDLPGRRGTDRDGDYPGRRSGDAGPRPRRKDPGAQGESGDAVTAAEAWPETPAQVVVNAVRREDAGPEEISDEWARYRERALKDAARGRAPRAFVSDVLPVALHEWVADRLAACGTKDEVRAVFAEAREREQGDVATPVAPPPPPPSVAISPLAFADQREVVAGLTILELRELRARLGAALDLAL